MYALLTSLALAAAPQAVTPVGSIQKLEVPTNPVGTVVIDVELNGRSAELVLDRHSVRSGDFQMFVTRPDGSPMAVPAPAPKTYRGTITGWPTATVAGSITAQGLSAVIMDPVADLEWQIQPAEGRPAGFYSVALVDDLASTPGVCGVDHTFAHIDPQTTSNLSGNRGTGLQLCELALDADWEFFQRNGNSVDATLDDMERVMNLVDVIYVRDSDVTFQITGVVIRTSSADPYTSADGSTRLGQFRSEWQSNFVGVRRDLAHLFTGVNINGGTIGVAYLSAVCTSSGYGFSESRFTNNLSQRTGLTAHEIGHNFAQNHCDGSGDCRIMCSGLGGCNNDLSRFGTAQATSVRNYAIGRSCLLDLAPPLAVPFSDDVPTGTINTDNWISNQGVLASTLGNNEPSGQFSYQFNAASNALIRDDVLISNKLLLAGESGFELFASVQARGVSAGNSIRFEIYNQADDWVEIFSVTSTGNTQDDFTVFSGDIPSNAYHDDAQIRITAEVDGPGENWYVDDIQVTDQGCGSLTTYCLGAGNSVSGAGANLTNVGSASLSANDFVAFGGNYPVNQFGIIIYGQGSTFALLGDGILCVATNPTLYRLTVFQTDLFGTVNVPVDYNNLAPGSSFSVGESWNWQAWYRDVTPAGSNLSSAFTVTFCP